MTNVPILSTKAPKNVDLRMVPSLTRAGHRHLFTQQPMVGLTAPRDPRRSPLVLALFVLAGLLLVCCWPKLPSATTILPTRYAHETLDHCSIDLQRLRRLRGRGRQQNPPDLRRGEQHAPMLGRSRAAHRSAASATAARGTGTAGGDPAAGAGDGALSTPGAMVAAAADLPVRSLRANSSATLSCPPSGRAPAY